jgi:hypothetical protein
VEVDMKIGTFPLAVAALSMLMATRATAGVINLGTDGVNGQMGDVGGWTVTGAGAVDATPYTIFGAGVADKPFLVLSSNGLSSGTPVPGASTADFDGLAIYSTTFFLPNTASAKLVYRDIGADDRFVVELNGHILGASGLFAYIAPQSGNFVFSHGGAPTPVTYQGSYPFDGLFGGNYGRLNGTDSSFLNIGGTNTLSVLVNSTFHGIYDYSTLNGLYSGDFKDNGFSASSIKVFYGVNGVPEPAAWEMLLLGFAGAGAMMRSCRRGAIATA